MELVYFGSPIKPLTPISITKPHTTYERVSHNFFVRTSPIHLHSLHNSLVNHQWVTSFFHYLLIFEIGSLISKLLFQPPDPPSYKDSSKLLWLTCPKRVGEKVPTLIPAVFLKHPK